MGWMQTYSGEAFDPLRPYDLAKIHIEDIAHALSLTCRYGGHCRTFYSVAEHCVLLSQLVDPQHALWALLHDATEAYIGDMVQPLKQEIPAFSLIEDRLSGAIANRFGLSWIMPDQVREYDLRIVLDEKAALLSAEPEPWVALQGVTPLGVDIFGWAPPVAERRYLHRYQQLTNNENKESRNG